MKRVFLISALALSVALPSAVYAAMDGKEKGHSKVEKMFERMDADKDGKVTKQEMSARGEKRFDRLDLDKDGVITLEEARDARKKMRQERKAKMMAKIDTDGNGLVSEAEFQAYTLKKFKKADKDGDGSLSSKEMKKMHRHMRHHG